MINTEVNGKKDNFIRKSVSEISPKDIKDIIFASTKEQVDLRNKCIIIGITVIILLVIIIWGVSRIIRSFTATEKDKTVAKLELEIEEMKEQAKQERLELEELETQKKERLKSLKQKEREQSKQKQGELKRLEMRELEMQKRQTEWKQGELKRLKRLKKQEQEQDMLDNEMKQEQERQEKRIKQEQEIQQERMLNDQRIKGKDENIMRWLESRRIEQEKKWMDIKRQDRNNKLEKEILQEDALNWEEYIEWKKQQEAVNNTRNN
ncbi:hypothetical protein NEIG_01121 [Nematocida sp. ERTm5]|nr:hypothetical protein NEIG_01121 [Nematocida sp. ERTm5]